MPNFKEVSKKQKMRSMKIAKLDKIERWIESERKNKKDKTLYAEQLERISDVRKYYRGYQRDLKSNHIEKDLMIRTSEHLVDKVLRELSKFIVVIKEVEEAKHHGNMEEVQNKLDNAHTVISDKLHTLGVNLIFLNGKPTLIDESTGIVKELEEIKKQDTYSWDD